MGNYTPDYRDNRSSIMGDWLTKVGTIRESKLSTLRSPASTAGASSFLGRPNDRPIVVRASSRPIAAKRRG